MTLDQIGIINDTDKSSVEHDYLNFYEQFFQPFRSAKISVLEIGVLKGASLATWSQYFENAYIIGLDIDPTTKRFEREKVKIELVDQGNIEQLVSVARQYGPFDIIIEDGSHLWEHQITTLKTLFPFVNDKGIYIVEDLQTNYGSMKETYQRNASESCVEYLKKWLDLKVADTQIDTSSVEDAFLRSYGREVDFLAFYKRACLIKKGSPAKRVESGTGHPLIDVRESNSARVIAHVGFTGDMFSAAGYINSVRPNSNIQALTITCEPDILEYRVKLANGDWTNWAQAGSQVGTQGQNLALTGVSVRLLMGRGDDYSLQYAARFGEQILFSDDSGNDLCGASDTDLSGFQIILIKINR